MDGVDEGFGLEGVTKIIGVEAGVSRSDNAGTAEPNLTQPHSTLPIPSQTPTKSNKTDVTFLIPTSPATPIITSLNQTQLHEASFNLTKPCQNFTQPFL